MLKKYQPWLKYMKPACCKQYTINYLDTWVLRVHETCPHSVLCDFVHFARNPVTIINSDMFFSISLSLAAYGNAVRNSYEHF